MCKIQGCEDSNLDELCNGQPLEPQAFLVQTTIFKDTVLARSCHPYRKLKDGDKEKKGSDSLREDIVDQSVHGFSLSLCLNIFLLVGHYDEIAFVNHHVEEVKD